ncbi:hypothetical protein [Archangium violaceum]
MSNSSQAGSTYDGFAQEVIAQGTVQKPDTNRYSLADATLCTLPNP